MTRSGPLALAVACVAAAAVLGLGRAVQADEPKVAPGNTEPKISISGVTPNGAPATTQTSELGRKYDGNPDYIAEGRSLYVAFNCVGCHSNGGGGMGPPLTAHAWRYGSSIENVAESIFQGRPNGMPTWRGTIPNDQVWAIAAYVRSLTPKGPTDPM